VCLSSVMSTMETRKQGGILDEMQAPTEVWTDIVCPVQASSLGFLASRTLSRSKQQCLKTLTMLYQYNYYNSGHYLSTCLLFKMQRSGDWILSLSPETGTKPVDLVQLSRHYTKTETEFSLRNVVF
jgi:hypothetical protein